VPCRNPMICDQTSSKPHAEPWASVAKALDAETIVPSALASPGVHRSATSTWPGVPTTV
jgi:hypothetical protein